MTVGRLHECENLAGRAALVERLRIVLDHVMPDATGRSVLDLGCGIGLLARALIEHGFQYTGVDVSVVAVEQARENCPDGRAEFVVGDLVAYEDPRQFDVVVASYVLVHLVEDSDWHTTLKHIAGMLRDDGCFILIDDVPETSPDQKHRHVRTRGLEEYRAALPACGLKPVAGWLEGGRAALGSEDLSNFVLLERDDARRSLDNPRP